MKEYNSIGKINISKIHSNGEELFDSHIKEVYNFISMKFYKGKLEYSSNSKDLRIYQDNIITSIYLTNEQFSYFLLNKNKGTPCTIMDREDEKFEIKKYQLPKDNKNYYQQIIEELKKEIVKIFPLNYKIKKLSKELIEQQNLKELNKLNQECFNEWKNNQKQLKELLNKTFQKLKDYNEDNLIEKNKEEFANILGINNSNLLENNKKLPINKRHGYIVLKEIKSKEGFVEDLNVINGYRITVYQAIEEILDNKHIIKPSNEVLVSMELSVSQFSNLITSFNQGEGITSTLIETKNLGKIKKDFNSIYLDNFERKFDNFITTIEENNKYLEELENKIDNSLKRKYKSKTKQRELEINFEQYFNKTISNIVFYTKDLLEESIKQNLSKHQDFISNIDRKLQDIAKKEVLNKININKTLLLN